MITENTQNTLPAALVLGEINGREIRVRSIMENTLHIETYRDLNVDKSFTILILLFQLDQYTYREFQMQNCTIVDCTAFCDHFVYVMQIGDIDEPDAFWVSMQRIYDIPKEQNHAKKANQNDDDSLKYKNTNDLFDNWYAYELTKENREQFLSLSEQLNVSIAINNPASYQSVLKHDSRNWIYAQLQKGHLQNHPLFSKPIRYVNIGNEFCYHLLPDKNLLSKLLDALSEYHITITLPFVRENYADSILKYVDFISQCIKNREQVEVAINDWGLIHYIKERQLPISMILGRVLNKREKDPRQSPSLKNSHRRNYLNAALMEDVLRSHGINRYEYEAHTLIDDLPLGNHSLHVPFYQMNTSEFCPLNAQCVNLNPYKQNIVEHCPHYCSEFYYMYSQSLPMIGVGNTILGYSKQIFENAGILTRYVDMGVDRLIYSSIG